MKTVQITEDLFFKLFKYHVLEINDYDLSNDIKKELELKFDKMIKHHVYTKSKTADTPEAREKARQEYLDMIGMHQDWRW